MKIVERQRGLAENEQVSSAPPPSQNSYDSLLVTQSFKARRTGLPEFVGQTNADWRKYVSKHGEGRIINSFRGLIHNIAGRYYSRSLHARADFDLDDICAFLNQIALKAIREFDPTRVTVGREPGAFTRYMATILKKRLNGLQRAEGGLGFKRLDSDFLVKAHRAHHKLAQELRGKPTEEQMAQALGLSVARYREHKIRLMTLRNNLEYRESFAGIAAASGSLRAGDCWQSGSSYYDDATLFPARSSVLDQILAKMLVDEEQHIARNRHMVAWFILEPYRITSFREVIESYGTWGTISDTRTSQIIRRAVNRLSTDLAVPKTQVARFSRDIRSASVACWETVSDQNRRDLIDKFNFLPLSEFIKINNLPHPTETPLLRAARAPKKPY